MTDGKALSGKGSGAPCIMLLHNARFGIILSKGCCGTVDDPRNGKTRASFPLPLSTIMKLDERLAMVSSWKRNVSGPPEEGSREP